MELEISYQAEPRGAIASLWWYYLYVFAPRCVSHILSVVILYLVYRACGDEMLLYFAWILLTILLLEFPVFCWRYIKIMRATGAFEQITTIKLNEDCLSMQQGGNRGTTELRSLSGYFIFNKRLFLLIGGKNLFGGISLDKIPDGRETAQRIMQKNGVRKVDFMSFRRWAFACLLLLLTIIIIVVQA